MLSRRRVTLGLTATLAATTAAVRRASAQNAHHNPLYSHLHDKGVTAPPDETLNAQRVTDSPAPRAANQGRWVTRAPLPLPRSEMAWAAVLDDKMHIVGGYAEQRVDRPYHHAYDAKTDRWISAPLLPRGANHVGVAVLGGKLYAVGGHLDQNRRPDNLCFVLDGETWKPIAPLPKAAGAIGVVARDGLLHAVGGAVGDTTPAKLSLDWHLVHDPKADRWTTRAPLPTARDHIGIVEKDGAIHVVGGRVNNFYTNSNLHHVYDAAGDKWVMRAPLPTARSGHGSVLYRGKMFVMGGEGSQRVFGQNEAYDFASDTWEAYAPMPTPRHGLGAVAIGDFIHVAGGGPIMGGEIQSAVHEAFTLG
ncbi:MAG: Kelch repeat-containing protein [Pseudolabrys sp.]